jgi:hypothetical protein
VLAVGENVVEGGFEAGGARAADRGHNEEGYQLSAISVQPKQRLKAERSLCLLSSV